MVDLDRYVEGSVWFYKPNNIAPIVFAIVFLISGLVHLFQNLRYKTWLMTGILPWAGLIMCAGFALREVGAYHYKDVGILIASTVCIMSGPPVYAAVNYFILSRILYYIPYLSPIHPGRVLTTFLGLDTLCEYLIGQGASRMVNTTISLHARQIGADLVKASLILQACMFVLFALLAAVFQRRARKAGVLKRELKIVFAVLYISCAMITIRCIYRIVEFFEGFTGTLYTTEPYFWVFEASIMFVNTAMLNCFHPARYLPRSNKIFLAKDGVTEREGPGWKDNRPFLVTVFDPFDLAGLVTGRDKKTRFWELPLEELEALRRQVEEEKRRKKERLRRVVDPFGWFGKKKRSEQQGVVERDGRDQRDQKMAGNQMSEQVV